MNIKIGILLFVYLCLNTSMVLAQELDEDDLTYFADNVASFESESKNIVKEFIAGNDNSIIQYSGLDADELSIKKRTKIVLDLSILQASQEAFHKSICDQADTCCDVGSLTITPGCGINKNTARSIGFQILPKNQLELMSSAMVGDTIDFRGFLENKKDKCRKCGCCDVDYNFDYERAMESNFEILPEGDWAVIPNDIYYNSVDSIFR